MQDKICTGCGSPAAFQTANGKWYCMASYHACPAVLEKRRKTYLKKYGTEHPNRSPEVQSERKRHNIEKYGVDHPMKAEALQGRVAKTNRERYGVDNPFAAKSVQAKIKRTNVERYGVENVSQSSEIQARREATFLKRFGATQILATEAAHVKGRATRLRKYGVEHLSQHPMYFRIMQKDRFRRKPVEAGGKLFMVQGAEGQVLLELLDNGFPASAIETDPSKVPAIWYTKPSGRRARYYPDIYIPHRNWIIEVKSMYTFLANKETNLLKRSACIKAGYRFNFIVR